MQWKRISALSFGALLAASLCACSYKQIEDGLRGTAQGSKELTEDELAQNEMIEKVEALATEEFEDKVYRIGDTVTWTDYSGGRIQYTLKEVRTGNNIGDFGVSIDDFTNTSKAYISESGDALGNGTGTYIFVEADVEVENINYEGFYGADFEPYSLYAETSIKSQSELDDSEGVPHNMEAVYFSHHAEEEQKYFFYHLEPGQTAEVQLIWIVPETDMQEPLYYVVGAANSKELQQFFQMND